MGVRTDEGRSAPDAAIALTERGAAIYCDPADPRAAHLVETHGDFNPGSLRLWRRVVGSHPWPVVVDVGANYGEMLVGPALPAGATVLAFEPNLRLHPYLRRTLEEAGLIVQLRPDALAARPGTATLAVDTEWSGTSSLVTQHRPDGGRWHHREVPATTLDDVLGPEPVSFCVKIDVEGLEPQVLEGASRSLSWTLPWALMFEVAHLSRAFLAALAQRLPVLALDLRTDRLVRLPGGNAELLEQLLDSSWLYPQDCVLVNVTALPLLDAASARTT